MVAQSIPRSEQSFDVSAYVIMLEDLDNVWFWAINRQATIGRNSGDFPEKPDNLMCDLGRTLEAEQGGMELCRFRSAWER